LCRYKDGNSYSCNEEKEKCGYTELGTRKEINHFEQMQKLNEYYERQSSFSHPEGNGKPKINPNIYLLFAVPLLRMPIYPHPYKS